MTPSCRSAARLARWLLCLLWVPAAALPADELAAIPLEHRLAEDLIPVLQPLLPAGAALTGTGNVLLLRADAATLRQVRSALEALDRAPRQLTITVGQATQGSAATAGVHGSATVGSGDVQVGVGQPPGTTTGAQVTVHGAQTRDDIRSVSSVRALEGREAYVAVGASLPYASSSVVHAGRHGGTVAETTAYRDVQTGFYATPRLNGDRVTLEISPTQQQATIAAQRPAVATQTLTTTVSGRLGEWIPLGGVDDARNGGDAGLLTWGTRSELTRFSAWVKVEEVR